MKPNSTFDLEKHLEQICRVNYENKENKDEPDDNTAPYNVDLKPYCSFETYLNDITGDVKFYSFLDTESFDPQMAKKKLLNIEKEYMELFLTMRGLQFPETYTQFIIILLEITNEKQRDYYEHLTNKECSVLCRKYPKLALFYADYFTERLDLKYMVDEKNKLIFPSVISACFTLDKIKQLDYIEDFAAKVFMEVMTERILKENIYDYLKKKKK